MNTPKRSSALRRSYQAVDVWHGCSTKEPSWAQSAQYQASQTPSGSPCRIPDTGPDRLLVVPLQPRSSWARFGWRSRTPEPHVNLIVARPPDSNKTGYPPLHRRSRLAFVSGNPPTVCWETNLRRRARWWLDAPRVDRATRPSCGQPASRPPGPRRASENGTKRAVPDAIQTSR